MASLRINQREGGAGLGLSLLPESAVRPETPRSSRDGIGDGELTGGESGRSVRYIDLQPNQHRHFRALASETILKKLSISPPSNYAPTLVMHRHVAGSAVAIRALWRRKRILMRRKRMLPARSTRQDGEATPCEVEGNQASLRPLSAASSAPGVGPTPAARPRFAAQRTASPQLQTTQPVMTALIDPVPLGHFPTRPRSRVRMILCCGKMSARMRRLDADPGRCRPDIDAPRWDLVALPASGALVVDERLPANRRYCRAWTAQFLSDLSRVHYGRFHRPLQVNSAVRTVEYQRHLERVNGNAAPAEGEDASPHLTGATIDIAKKGLSMEEIGWMRAYLAPLQAAGKIDVEEEFYQACFHITVYRSYRPDARRRGGQSQGECASRQHARRCWRRRVR